MSSWTLKLAVAASAAALILGCGKPPANDPCDPNPCPSTATCNNGTCIPITNGGGGNKDAGTDAGNDKDAGVESDAGIENDAGVENDAGIETDAGIEDAGVEVDAGVEDAGTPVDVSQQILDARATADGTGYTLPIDGALVTYIKPVVGTEPAGFTIQADPMGPALFVNVDPATLTPAPAVGDIVAFTITDMGTLFGMREATAIDPATFSVVSSGNSTSGYVQNLSASTDLVTSLDTYEAELASVSGTITGNFGSAGAGYQKASITTAGYPSGDANLKIRVPITLKDQLDLVNGCSFTVNAAPVWRNVAEAQVAAWTASDITLTSCPAPKLLSAVATSLTQVQLTFDRQIAPATVNANAFTFDNGLVATAATATGKTVLIDTSLQVAGTTYTVTVANTVTDTVGTPIDAAAMTATFVGYQIPAQVLLSEVNSNISGSRDLFELYVTAAGTTSGITISQLGTTAPLATLPAINVAVGDLIVVHLTPTAAELDETVSKNQFPSNAVPSYYDGAWDVRGAAANATYSNRVIVVKSAAGTMLDAVAFVVGNSSTPPSAYPSQLQTVQASGDWVPADCGGALCTYTTTPSALDVSVHWEGLTTNATTSVARVLSTTDTHSAADWTAAGASTFGVVNP